MSRPRHLQLTTHYSLRITSLPCIRSSPATTNYLPPPSLSLYGSSSMGSCNENVFVWNMQGLNSRAHQDVVRDECVLLLYLEETKMDVISP